MVQTFKPVQTQSWACPRKRLKRGSCGPEPRNRGGSLSPQVTGSQKFVYSVRVRISGTEPGCLTPAGGPQTPRKLLAGPGATAGSGRPLPAQPDIAQNSKKGSSEAFHLWLAQACDTLPSVVPPRSVTEKKYHRHFIYAVFWMNML